MLCLTLGPPKQTALATPRTMGHIWAQLSPETLPHFLYLCGQLAELSTGYVQARPSRIG